MFNCVFYENFEDVIEKHDDFFNDLVPSYVDDSNHEKVADCLKKLYLYNILNKGTGIVIAGFTKNNFHPSLINFTLSLNYYDEEENVNKAGIIDYIEMLNITANGIIPFAQKDVIENFLTGISRNINKSFISYLKLSLENLLYNIKDEFALSGEFDEDTLKKILNTFDEIIDESAENLDDIVDDFKKDFVKPFLDSIGHMPKDELVNMAESLIHITSLKRKVDSNLETVGGKINVAFLSDGKRFSWIEKNSILYLK